MACLGEHRDGTLFELRNALAAQGILISKSALHRFLVRHEQTRKKDWPRGRAKPPGRSGNASMLVQRALDLDPARLVFIDESVLQSSGRSST
jgi:hypothetical protein